MRLALAAGLLWLAAGTAAGEELQRLFLNPEQRQRIDLKRNERPDQARSSQAGSSELLDAETTPPPPQPAPAEIEVNGVVKRSSGKNMVWINGRMQTEPGLRTDTHALQGISVPVWVLQHNYLATLKPGEKIFVGTEGQSPAGEKIPEASASPQQ